VEDKYLLNDVEKLAGSLGVLPEPEASPVLIAVSGLPGTGKTYFSQKLSERLPAVVLESDVLRKVIFQTPEYSQQESTRLFKACYFLIEMLLGKGISVILDATNLIERHRERLYRIAALLKAKLILARMEAPPQVVKNRLDLRAVDASSHSDADWAVYQKMRLAVDKIGRRHYVVDTSKDVMPVIDKIVREVNLKGE